MVICYKTDDAFYAGIYRLVMLGLTFEADDQDLSIQLTGGY
jgi:hypothetical protein